MEVLGVPHLGEYLLLGFAAYVMYAAYWSFTATRRGKRNMNAVISRTEEIAAQAHADAERIIALLTEIRDQLGT